MTTPVWLSKLLAIGGKLLPYILLAALIVIYSNRLYDKGEAAAEARFTKLQNESKARTDALVEQIQKDQAETLAAYRERVEGINTRTETHTQTIIKEVADSPRLQDPEQGITPAMLETINAARKESHR